MGKLLFDLVLFSYALGAPGILMVRVEAKTYPNPPDFPPLDEGTPLSSPSTNQREKLIAVFCADLNVPQINRAGNATIPLLQFPCGTFRGARRRPTTCCVATAPGTWTATARSETLIACLLPQCPRMGYLTPYALNISLSRRLPNDVCSWAAETGREGE